jgi:hypothetical protein
MAVLAAAGIVVTEISTPINAPDFAVLSESIPATPASRPMVATYQSGEAIVRERLWSLSSNVAGSSPVSLARSPSSSATTIARGKPTASAAKDLAGQPAAALDHGDAEPGDRAELGAYDHRPHDEDRAVEDDAHPAMSVAITMKAR